MCFRYFKLNFSIVLSCSRGTRNRKLARNRKLVHNHSRNRCRSRGSCGTSCQTCIGCHSLGSLRRRKGRRKRRRPRSRKLDCRRAHIQIRNRMQPHKELRNRSCHRNRYCGSKTFRTGRNSTDRNLSCSRDLVHKPARKLLRSHKSVRTPM
jgi:hypothetical protein